TRRARPPPRRRGARRPTSSHGTSGATGWSTGAGRSAVGSAPRAGGNGGGPCRLLRGVHVATTVCTTPLRHCYPSRCVDAPPPTSPAGLRSHGPPPPRWRVVRIRSYRDWNHGPRPPLTRVRPVEERPYADI